MLIATFGPSTGWHGKTITYDAGRFTLEGHGEIPAAGVLDYDRQGHLVWGYEGLKEWVRELAGEPPSPSATPQPAMPAPLTAVSPPAQPPSVGPVMRVGEAPWAGRRKTKPYVWVITGVVAFVLIVAVIAGIAGGGSGSDGTAPATVAENTPAAAPAAPSSKTYSDGTYLVGTDIPAGDYRGTVTGGAGYWQLSTDTNGENIIANDNPTGPFRLQARDGQYLQLSGVEIARAAKDEPAAVAAKTIGDGTYLVGTDIPTGNYKGTTVAGTGYWQISRDANGQNITANDNSTGPLRLMVKRGQYLQLSGIEITRVTTAEQPAKYKGPVGEGTYLVGIDIPAGAYKGDTMGGDGYWQISTDANGTNIVANNNTTGPFRLDVKKGQYLRLSGAEVDLAN